MKRTIVYFAHPLRGATAKETAANREAASALVARASAIYPIAPVCSWIVLSSQWSEEEGRALGLEIDCALIERCDELWLCGPRRPLSEGMKIESAHARKRSILARDLRGYRFDGTLKYERIGGLVEDDGGNTCCGGDVRRLPFAD